MEITWSPSLQETIRAVKTTATERSLKVAYIMSRFPKITETFILFEILAMEQQGVPIAIYPLQREQTPVMHPEAVPLVERAHFHPFISWEMVQAHLYFLRHKPLVYLGILWALLRGTWGSLRYFIGALAFFPKAVHFARQMTAEGITHIHAHFASHPAAAAFVIHRLTGIPYSFTAHGSDIHRDRHMLRQKVAEAAFVVAISAFNRDVILAECGQAFSHKLVVIHCGVDTQVFQPVNSEQLAVNSEQLAVNSHLQPSPLHPFTPSPKQPKVAHPFILLCIGTLHEVKGQTYLVEACRLLRQRGVPFTCHFIGDGSDLPALQKQVDEAGLTDTVLFHGRQTRTAIAGFLQKADVVIAPSVPSRDGRREGIPVVLMEAMACGVPVVASRLSGIPELVQEGKSGFLTPPGDSHALANSLECLYREPDLRQRLGQAGREWVVQAFNLHTNAGLLAQSFSRGSA